MFKQEVMYETFLGQLFQSQKKPISDVHIQCVTQVKLRDQAQLTTRKIFQNILSLIQKLNL